MRRKEEEDHDTDKKLTGQQVAVQIEFYKVYKYFNVASKLSFYFDSNNR